MTDQVSNRELRREMRVLDQTLSMHCFLRDRHKSTSLLVDVILLGCAVVFNATTFARDELFAHFGLSPQNVHYILGVSSVVALFASLIGLRTDWKGSAARHHDATQRLTKALALFKQLRQSDGDWPQERTADLKTAYWEAMNNVSEIPSAQFIRLKARHLRKVEISRMLDTRPGCPILLLRIILFFRSVSVRKQA